MFTKVLVALLLVTLVAGQTVNPTQDQLNANDKAALQLAYAAETLEQAFYTQGQAKFNASSFSDPTVYPTLGLILNHENAHVQYLTAVLRAYNVTLPTCTFNVASFLVSNATYLTGAYTLENLGVQAYNGIINTVFNQSVVGVLGTITTIEARHAAWLSAIPTAQPSLYPVSSPTSTLGFLPTYVNCTGGLNIPTPVIKPVVWVNTTRFPSVPPTATDFAVSQNDIAVLNYAYLLENFEAAFYRYGNAMWNYANATGPFGATVGPYLNLILGHETAHVSLLNTTILGLGGVPYYECVFNFSSITTPAAFLSAAATFETVGTYAYDGVLNATNNAAIRQTALQIADIEAQHAANLNRIANITNPTGAYDGTYSPAQVFAIITSASVTPRYASCGTWAPVIPQVLKIYPYQNNTATATSGSSTTFIATGTSPANRVAVSFVALFFSAIAAFLLL